MPYSVVSDFLEMRLDPSKPVLIACSGGPDSMALLSLTLLFRQKHPFDLAVVHVDHGWRPESEKEALILQRIVEQYGLPFYCKKIVPEERNIEGAFRKERLGFFKELCESYGYQAVLLGHHADDQSETVLKRVLEGAAMTNLCGLCPVSKVEGVVLWRPLLELSKNRLLEWNEEFAIDSFDDVTNRDTRYLRARFRQSIIPQLEKEFGKNIKNNLCRLGKEAQYLREYLDTVVAPFLRQVRRGSLGCYLDLTETFPKNDVEIRHLVRKFCREEEITLTETLLGMACTYLRDKVPDRRMTVAKQTLEFDRGRLFLCKPECDSQEVVPMKSGVSHCGPWRVTVAPYQGEQIDQGWKSVWQGKVEAVLPLGKYVLGPPKMNASYPGNSSISHWWGKHKIPTFLRREIPVIWGEGNRIHHEFLTGRVNPKQMELERNIKFTMEFVKR